MGKQMTSVLKNRANNLYKENKDAFTEDFQENKQKLKELQLFDYSKTDRNVVAGYLTRTIKKINRTVE